MALPWEQYGDAAVAAPPPSGPWETYQPEDGPWKRYEPAPQGDTLREPTLKEKIALSPLGEFLGIGHGEDRKIQRERGGPQGVMPQDIVDTLFQVMTPPPPAREAIDKATDPAINMLPDGAAGVAQGIREVGESVPWVAGPAGVLKMGPALGKGLLAAFGGQWAWELPEQKAAFDAALAAGNKKEAYRLATSAVLTGTLLGAGAVGEMKSGKSEVGGRRSEVGEQVPVPESTGTLAAQLAAVQEGRRPAMLVTPGEAMPAEVPDGLESHAIEGKGTYVYNPAKTNPGAIAAAVADGSDGLLLGMGSGAKPAGSDVVLQTKTADGTPLTDEVVNAQTLPAAEAAAAVQKPEGGTTELRPAGEVLAERAAPNDFPEGPGAQTAGKDKPLGSQLRQLTEILPQLGTPEQTVGERVGLADRVGRIAAGTKEAVSGALLRLRAQSAAVVDAYVNLPKFTEFKRTLGDWQGADQKAGLEARRFVQALRERVKDPGVREAITNWIQADGDSSLLAQRAAQSGELYRRGYERAQRLTPEERILAENIRQYFDSRMQEGVEAGILSHGLDNYVNQIWKRANPVTDKLVADLGTGKLRPDFKFARKRIFDSFFEGERAGYRPATKDIGQLVTIYDQAFNRSLSARTFIRQLQQGKASDGRPLVEVSGNGRLVEGDEGGAIFVKPRALPEAVNDYRVVDHPALRKWKWVQAAPDGTSVMLQGDMRVHPEVYKPLRNVLATSWWREQPVLRNILNAQAVAKRTIFSLSPFHQVQEGTHALGHRVNPLNPMKVDLDNPVQMELVNRGLKVADFDAHQLFEEGMHGGGVTAKIPVVGPTQRAYTDWLFHEQIPRLKMTMAMDAFERNLKRYGKQMESGKVTRDQIAELTARQANAAFGELNYKYMARHPNFQDAMRMFLIAPDFLEARSKFVGQAAKPYGREQLVALGLIAAAQYATSRILNEVLDDNPHWDKPFTVVYKKRSYGLRTVPSDLEELIGNFQRFATNRLSPFVGRGLAALLEQHRTGNADTAAQVKDLLTSMVPMSLRKRTDDTLWQAALSAMGLRNKPYTAVQQVHEWSAEWRKESKTPDHVLVLGESIYKPLRMALMSNDGALARKEYQKLLETKSPTDIFHAFKNAKNAPFTGSEERDRKFVNQLPSWKRGVWEEAKRERQELFWKFASMPR